MRPRDALAAVALAGALSAVPAVASAEPAQNPPTTVEVSTVERQVPVTTITELEKKDDDSNWGWIGIFGLLGLAGLAGLAGRRRRDDDASRGYSRTVPGDSTPRGSTPTNP